MELKDGVLVSADENRIDAKVAADNLPWREIRERGVVEIESERDLRDFLADIRETGPMHEACRPTTDIMFEDSDGLLAEIDRIRLLPKSYDGAHMRVVLSQAILEGEVLIAVETRQKPPDIKPSDPMRYSYYIDRFGAYAGPHYVFRCDIAENKHCAVPVKDLFKAVDRHLARFGEEFDYVHAGGSDDELGFDAVNGKRKLRFKISTEPIKDRGGARRLADQFFKTLDLRDFDARVRQYALPAAAKKRRAAVHQAFDPELQAFEYGEEA